MTNTVADRPRSAEDTLEAIKPWLEKAGVTRLADVTGMDRIGIPVYASVRPDSLSLAVDSGKGTTKAQAKCSAAMEALERWAGDTVKLARVKAPVEPQEFNFPLNRGAVFQPSQLYDMTYSVDMESGDTVAVPYYSVKLYDEIPLRERPWYSTTNGLSAGSTREDAIISGIYEVIERDAVTIAIAAAQFGHTAMRRVDLDHTCNEECIELIDMIRGCGAKVFVYDCTSDIGIPSYLCIISEPERGMGLHRGAGCHCNADVAMARAICEAAQTRCILMAGARDDITVARYKRNIGVSQDTAWAQTLASEPFAAVTKKYISASVMEVLSEKGFRVLVVDYPLNDAPFSVVKVLIPMLEGYHTPYVELGDRYKEFIKCSR